MTPMIIDPYRFGTAVTLPAYRSSSAAALYIVPGSTTFSPTKPTGTVDGDLLLTVVCIDATSETLTTLAGWTLLTGPTDASNCRTWTYYKIASSEPASWTWTKSGTGVYGSAVVFAISGASGVDVSGAQGNGTSTNITAPTVTTTVPVTLFHVATERSGNSITPPSGYTERSELAWGGLPHIALSDKAFATPGATGAASATIGSSANNVGVHIAVKP